MTNGYIGGLIGEGSGFIRDAYVNTDIYIDELDPDGGASMNNVVDGVGPNDIKTKLVTASAKEYNSEDFYTSVLNWSNYFWDFSSMIVTADIMPTHK